MYFTVDNMAFGWCLVLLLVLRTLYIAQRGVEAIDSLFDYLDKKQIPFLCALVLQVVRMNYRVGIAFNLFRVWTRYALL
jgi:hypothetical protein